ncbi:hypothetical protein D7B24_009249 [Verticillium nonalfalfae]|uniref:Zn(2)-C6 fungal-type domain-containing protein n=1 Tax=Verticillium nonalfalfae TaxID=1051616 RepID=A0A3M9YI14_9PEZI|nr:uncharacterized protein D7B24_009249 [Verticillium nonalfalfae]RNJ60217.1 hypothetical protein D7B24_009249 [Verticillium nonalfalfae]
MNRSFRSILPHPNLQSSSSSGLPLPQPYRRPTGRTPRQLTLVACARCRRGKSKCDGDRPVCGSCKRKKTACVYDVAETNTTRAMAARQQQANQRLENEQLHELFRILRTLPHADAHAALDQLRTADNALSALRSLTGSQLMIYRLDEFPDPQGGNLRLEAIDRGALVDSPFKVEARPWTAVAGSGIVSELISSFFTWDASFFYPFVYLLFSFFGECNYTSRRVKSFDGISGRKLGAQFLDEANKWLEIEGQRSTLPTAQGLALLFTLYAYRGMDRAGMMYRFAATEMFLRLDLEARFEAVSNDQQGKREKAIISTALWGFFCYESIVSYVYIELSLIRPPRIPCVFEFEELAEQSSVKIDLYGNPVYMDEVLVSVLRPLDPNTVFLDDLTVKDICLGLAYTDTTYMMRYIKEYTLRDYSCVVLCGLYNALFTMAPYLGDPTIHQLFAETSYLMRQTARDFPMSSFILQAIKAFAWTSSLPLPIAAAPYFEDLGMTKQELQDLPLGFALPKTNEIRDIFMREGQELSGVAVDMGKLLSRWCTLSLDE